ncbi:MAG: hypothetical protein AB2725_13990 [Candidatus Thiodiazotropha endolucinida]
MILEHDDVRLAQNYDDGMERCTNLGVVRDVAIDPVNDDLKSDGLVEGFVAYRHQWDSKWRSNLIYNPTKPITLGVMYLKGELGSEMAVKKLTVLVLSLAMTGQVSASRVTIA